MRPTSNSTITNWPNLERACDIAALGGYTVQVISPPDYIQGFKDYVLIKEFYNNIKFVEDGDLIVSINPPNPNFSNYSQSRLDVASIKELVPIFQNGRRQLKEK